MLLAIVSRLGARALSAAIQAVFLIGVARILGPVSFGELAVGLSAGAVVGATTNLGVNVHLLRVGLSRDADAQIGASLFAAVWLSGMSIAVVLAAGVGVFAMGALFAAGVVLAGAEIASESVVSAVSGKESPLARLRAHRGTSAGVRRRVCAVEPGRDAARVLNRSHVDADVRHGRFKLLHTEVCSFSQVDCPRCVGGHSCGPGRVGHSHRCPSIATRYDSSKRRAGSRGRRRLRGRDASNTSAKSDRGVCPRHLRSEVGARERRE